MKAKRKLKNVIVDFISLVHRGANNKTIIYKENQAGEDARISIQKLDEDKHLVYGIVYSPDEVDSQGDFAQKSTIQEMAYNFMKSGHLNNVDLQHNYNPGYGFIAESWLVKENDSVFPDEKEGSWAVVIKVEDSKLWDEIKAGKITGLSMAGEAEVAAVDQQDFESNYGRLLSLLNEFKCSVTEKMESGLKEQELLKARIEQMENISGKSKQLINTSGTESVPENIWL